MSDQVPEKVDAAASATEAPETTSPVVAKETDHNAEKDEKMNDVADKAVDGAPKDDAKVDETSDKVKETAPAAADSNGDNDKPAEQDDAEMKDAPEESSTDPAAAETPASNNNRRKSTGGASKSKTLAKKGSKAKISHRDAQPGDHFLVKLKGYPAWPAIVCDEEMLPPALLTTRPVTAARADGTYGENYADGGKRVNDRTFPVLYLHTNEFGWVHNGAFTELTPEKAQNSIKDKMRHDLKQAFELAAEPLSIEEYKAMLVEQEEKAEAAEKAKAEKKAKATATPKKSKKADDEDVDMADATQSVKSKSKKRKADEDVSTPQRSDSVKKPKIKLNVTSTPKAANGTPAKKEESASKPAKAAKKKSADKEKKSEASEQKKKEPKDKGREVMFLRHKLQRGLLTRDQMPAADEIPQMSEWLAMLEKMPDLEVSIIRATKINKVLKAMLKLDQIPREQEFKFHSRASALLDQWNMTIGAETNGQAKGDTSELPAEATKNDEKKSEETAGEQKKTEEQPATEKKEEIPEPEKKVDGEEAKDKPETETTAAEAVEAAA